MRNLKKYLSMALAIAMMIMAVVPATFAANDYESQANALYTMGLYKGLSEDAFVPDLESTLDRQTGAVMLLRTFGVEEEALAMEEAEANEILAEKFSDADMVAPWAAKQVAYATEMGVINGFPGGTFRPTGLLNGRQYCTLVLKQLGYEVDYQKAGEQFADVAGLNWAEESAFGTDGAITKDVLVGISFVTLTSKLANEEKTLMDKLVAEEVVEATVAEEAGVFVPPSTTTEEAIGTTEEAVVVPEGAATEMTEVKVTAQDTMVAMFDGVVATDAAFTVEGAMVVNPTVTWNEDKTEATIVAQSVLLDGNYTVKVVAGDLEDEATVVVSKNGIANIEILGDELIRTSALGTYADDAIEGTGFFYVKLTDTYGNDVTEKMAYDVTISFSKDTVGDLTIDPETGKVDVTIDDENWDDYPAVPEVVTVTAYSNTVGAAGIATASKVLTVTEQSRVKEIELGEVTFPGSASQAFTEKDPAAYVEITALDQYGYEVTDLTRLEDEDTLTEVVYSKSDSDLFITPEEYTDEDGNDKVRLAIGTNGGTNDAGTHTAIDEAKKITLSAISKYKGTVSNTVTIDVRVAKAPEKVTLGVPEQVIAEGDTFDETLILPFTAYDVDGNAMSTDDVIDAFNSGKITFEISSDSTIEVKVATTGDNKGKIVSDMAGVSEGAETLVVELLQSKTMRTATKVLTVKARAYATSLELAQSPATRLLEGATAKYSYDFYDQYGRKMNSNMLDDGSTDYTEVVLEATFPSGSDASFDIPGATNLTDGGTETATVYAYQLTADDTIVLTAGAEDGTVRLKAKLYKEYDQASQVDTDTRSFTIAEGIPSDVTFDIGDIPTLYAQAPGTGIDTYADLDDQADARYGMALELIAQDSSGNTYAVPFNQVLSVGTSDDDLVEIEKVTAAVAAANNTDLTTTEHEDKVVVWAEEWSDDATSKTATVTVNFRTDGEAQSVTKTVTLSMDAPKAEEIKFIDTAWDANYDLPSGYEEVEEITGAVAASGISATKFAIVYKDQYGVWTAIDDATAPGTNLLDVSNYETALDDSTTLTQVDALLAGTGVTTMYVIEPSQFTAANTAANEFLYLTYTEADSGLKQSVKAKVSALTADTTVPTLTSVSTADSDGDGKIEYTLTFSEAILDSTITLSEFEVDTFDVVDDAVSSLSGTGDFANDNVYVIENNTVDTDAMAIELADTGLTDLAGNLLAAATFTDTTDTVAVIMDSVSTADSDADGKIEYTLTFSEPIDDSTLTVANFEIGGTDVVVDSATALTGTGTADDVTYVIETSVVDTDAMAIEYDGTALLGLDTVALAAATVTDATDTVAPILVSAATSSGDNFDANTDVLTLTFSEAIAYGDEIAAGAVSLANLNDWLLLDYDGATGDELFVDTPAATTYTFALSGSEITITLDGPIDEAMTANTNVNLVDLSNIVDTAATPNESVANATDVSVTITP